MKSEKIDFFESNLLFTVQSDSGQTVSFRLDIQKMLQLLVSVFLLFLLLLSGTFLFFKERKTNEILVVKNLLNEAALSPITASNIKDKTHSKSKAVIQDFTGYCRDEKCFANLTLISQQSSTAEGSLIILLETLSPQIGSGNPTGKVNPKFYSYPAQNIHGSLTPEEIFSLKDKPFSISRSLTSKAEFNIGKFQRPLSFHLYLFDTNHELIKHETIQVIGEE